MSLETIKTTSNGLRGALPIELVEPTPKFSEEVKQLLKFHGIYQQHDRDIRGRNNRVFSFMIRSKLPGGRLSAQQYLVHDALADSFAGGALRLTTRQGIQFHGVIKGNLHSTLHALNAALVSTLGACGDVERNVMACPAPFGDPIREQMQQLAADLAEHLAPRTPAYHQIWVENDEGKKVPQKFEQDEAFAEVVEPIYGKAYLPRKFKTAIAYPGDNCTDILSNDVGLVGLIADDGKTIHGYNVFVGGGMGRTHNNAETYPALAQPLGYVTADKVIDVVEKIVLVQRDHGDREDRKHARMKYLVIEWGIDAFRAKVEEYLGYQVEPLHEMPPLGYDDHLGWHEQVDGRWFLGLYVENGRVRDDETRRLRSALRALAQTYAPDVTITGQQNILLSGFTTEQKAEVEELLGKFNVATVDQISTVRRHAMACPALPTCGLALAEAERYLPSLIDELEPIVAELGLDQDEFSIRMTGCPNGCARPYIAEIGIVGRTLGKYNVYLGGNMEGTRLNTLYRELVPAEELPNTIRTVLSAYVAERQPGEPLGDWAARVGIDRIPTEISTADTAAAVAVGD